MATPPGAVPAVKVSVLQLPIPEDVEAQRSPQALPTLCLRLIKGNGALFTEMIAIRKMLVDQQDQLMHMNKAVECYLKNIGRRRSVRA